MLHLNTWDQFAVQISHLPSPPRPPSLITLATNSSWNPRSVRDWRLHRTIRLRISYINGQQTLLVAWVKYQLVVLMWNPIFKTCFFFLSSVATSGAVLFVCEWVILSHFATRGWSFYCHLNSDNNNICREKREAFSRGQNRVSGQ